MKWHFWTSTHYIILNMLFTFFTAKANWCTRSWYHDQHDDLKSWPCVVQNFDTKWSQSLLLHSAQGNEQSFLLQSLLSLNPCGQNWWDFVSMSFIKCYLLSMSFINWDPMVKNKITSCSSFLNLCIRNNTIEVFLV